MITLFIFYLHVVVAVAIYTERWQDADWKEGLLGVGFFALLFSVGWSISTFIMKMLIKEEGFGVWLNRDTLSLLLLTFMEAGFYSIQLKRRQMRLSAGG